MVFRSLIKWFGGKSWLVEKLVASIPEGINNVVEVFGGAMWFTLNLPKGKYRNIISNDINGELVNFWECLRKNRHLLKERCDHALDSEELCYKWEAEWDKNQWKDLDEFDRAFRFLWMNMHTFSGVFRGYHGMNFVTPNQNQKAWLTKLDLFDAAWEQIKLVEFRNIDFEKLLDNKELDRDDIFIFLDPPYFHGGDKYETFYGGKEWTYSDFLRLRKLVHSFNHAKILITIDDGEFFMKDGWYLEEIEKTKMMRADAEIGRETIVTNFKPVETGKIECFNSFDW